MASTVTAWRGETRDEVAVRRERLRLVLEPEHDAAGVGLVQQPHRLEHQGNRGSPVPSTASNSSSERTTAIAGNGTPASLSRARVAT